VFLPFLLGRKNDVGESQLAPDNVLGIPLAVTVE
jgi:hypothetical protein